MKEVYTFDENSNSVVKTSLGFDDIFVKYNTITARIEIFFTDKEKFRNNIKEVYNKYNINNNITFEFFLKNELIKSIKLG